MSNTATETDQQSLLGGWIAEFAQHRQAIEDAILVLASHCQKMPSVRSEQDTHALLAWRHRVFGLQSEPYSKAALDEAAQRAADSLRAPLFELARAFASLLAGVETELQHLGNQCQAGVVAPSALPERVLLREFEQFFVHRRLGSINGLPDDHPLSEAISHGDLPADRRIFFGESVKTIGPDGIPHFHPPAWVLISQLRRACQERRAEEDRQAEEQARRQREEAARQRQLAEAAKSPEQRRIEQLERELESMKHQLNQQQPATIP